jgi:ribonuclease-3
VFRAVRRLQNLFRHRSKSDKELIRAVRTITGIQPIQLSLYKLALIHSSIAPQHESGLKESNERLEYLGDAILGACVADFLFKKFPFKDEGFLTEIRSRLVNREALNVLGRKLGVNELVQFDRKKKGRMSHKSLYGDTLEAFIGAVYLDHGFARCNQFILRRLMPYFDLENVVSMNPNYKSTLIEWVQQENKLIEFRIIDVKEEHQHREFTARIFIDDQPYGTGFGYSKKKAEQDAAQKTCVMLKLIEP